MRNYRKQRAGRSKESKMKDESEKNGKIKEGKLRGRKLAKAFKRLFSLTMTVNIHTFRSRSRKKRQYGEAGSEEGKKEG